MLDSELGLKKIAGGAAFVFLGFIIGKLFVYLSRVIIVRDLGIESYGLFSLSVAIIGIITTISLLGFNISLARFVPYFRSRDEPEKIKGSLKFSLKITLFLSIVLSFSVFLLADIISINFFNEPSMAQLIRIFVLIVPISVFLTILITTIRGFFEIKYKFFIEDFIKNVFTFSLLVVFVYLGFSLFGVIAAYILGTVVAALMAVYFLIKIFPLRKIKSKEVSKEIMSFSWPFIFIIFLGLFLSWTDTILLGYFKNAYDVGIYNIALTISGLILIGLDSMMYIFMPVMAGIYAKSGINNNFKKMYKIVSKWIFLITFPLILCIIIFSRNIIFVLFGRGDANIVLAATPMIILSIGLFIHSITNISAGILTTIGRNRINLIVATIAAIINLVLNLILIQNLGILGAAIGTSISFISMGLLNLYYGYRTTNLQPFGLNYIKPIFSGIVSIISIYFFTKFFFININIFSLIVIVPLFLFLYITLLLITRFFENEDILILRFMEKKTGIKSRLLRKFIKRFIK